MYLINIRIIYFKNKILRYLENNFKFKFPNYYVCLNADYICLVKYY